MANDATTNRGGISRGAGAAARRRAAIQAAAVNAKKCRRATTPRVRSQPAPPVAINGIGATPGLTTAADVFIAYAHSDGATVAQLVDDLRQTGVSVAWDRDILAGRQFRKDIQSAIREAAAAIVVWSDAAVDSHFVMDEADLALTQNKLVTTHVDGFDHGKIPMGFRQLQSISIADFGRIALSLAAFGVAVETEQGAT